MAHFIDSDVERILKVKDADLGLFVLAMHSLMEKTLKAKYESQSDFGTLINRYTADYGSTWGKPDYYKENDYYIADAEKKAVYKSLKKIYTNHYLSNDVRHQFAVVSPEQAKTTVQCFVAFARAENWNNSAMLLKLKKELDDWDNYSSYQSKELSSAIAEITRLQKENEGLAGKVNEYKMLETQYNHIEQQDRTLQAKLAETEQRLKKKDQKLDEFRVTANRQSEAFRKEKKEILEKMKDYEDTKRYLSYLEKVSFYTRTRHDYEQSIIRLSSEQKSVLDQIHLNKDFLIKGSAGTGKSLVLIKTLEKAVNDLKQELGFEEKKNSFRLLTYTKCLVKYNKYVSQLMDAEVPVDAITTADSFMVKMLSYGYPGKSVSFKFDKEAFAGIFTGSSFEELEVYNEAENFIWANCITREEYLGQTGKKGGMKTSLKKEDRELMWEAVSKAEEKLMDCKVWPRCFVAKKLDEFMFKASEDVRKDIFAEYSLIDEAQDLPAVILKLIKHTTNRAVFLAGDSDQSIYVKGFNWAKADIDIVGRTKILRTNFRNTSQIHDYAEEYRALFRNKDVKNDPSAFRPGPPVEHIAAKNTEELKQQLVQQVKMLIYALGYEEENICIIANTAPKLESIRKMLENDLGVATSIIDNDYEFGKTPGVKLSTIQHSKGLDFPVVLFFADHRIQGAQEKSVFDEETYMEQQYNLVYIALTRAMEMLYVFTVEGTGFEPYKALK